MNQLEDIYRTEEFKKLPWKDKLLVRIKVTLLAMLEVI